MRLKSLEVVGFKSFPDRTNINFEGGVTGIVGPNGCGKSNVVDAIRWVMGEQSAKHLRGTMMGDVIFNGTEKRPPMGLSSVFLTFDNSDGRAPAEYADYSEITVGRRLYRSGESEYYINKTPCRLKDIVDLFLGTGIGSRAYAIVEQGMIGQILNAKPEDRRVLIEEAAGISKFKVRKEAALRKMEATQANIARLVDILAELGRQKNSLYRQAKKAERYKIFSDELTGLELKVSARRYETLRGELDELKQNLEELKVTELSGVAGISADEAEIESSRLKLGELEQELDSLQEAIYERQNEVQLTEAEISYKVRDVEQLEAQGLKFKSEIEDLFRKIDRWRLELATANAGKVGSDLRMFTAEENLVGIDERLQSLRDEHHALVESLEDSRKKLFASIEEVSGSSTKSDQLMRREKDIKVRIERDQLEVDRLDSKIKEIENKIGVQTGSVTETKQLKLGLDSESVSARATLEMQKEELAKVEASVAFLKDELNQKKSRLGSLGDFYKNYEGYKDGVRNILKRKQDSNEFGQIIGTINDIVETGPEYETAVGAVLGEKLEYIVVKSREAGIEAVDYLKTQAAGRSTFVPLSLRAAEPEAGTDEITGEGIIGPLSNYVSYADDYKKVVNYLLKDVVLVSDINKAFSVWADNGCKSTLVTLDGDIIDPAGVITAGQGGDGSTQLMAHRREIKELTESVARLTSGLTIEEERQSRLRERVNGLRESIEKLESDAHNEEIKLIYQQKELHHLQQELNYCRSQRDKLAVEIAAFVEEKTGINGELESARAAFESGSIGKKQNEDEVNRKQVGELELRNRLQELIQVKAELLQQVKTEKERLANLEREIERLITSIVEASSNIADSEYSISVDGKVINTFRFEIECRKKQLHYLISLIGEIKNQHLEKKSSYDSDLASVREREAMIRDLRKRHEDQLKKLHEYELSFTQKQEKLNYLVREIFEKYRVSLEESYREHLAEGIDMEESSVRVDDLKEKLNKIGMVNLDAIKEYEEVKGRHDFLESQYNDLNTSLDDLKKAIQKINKTSRVRFEETFVSVDERFQKLFPKLFEGGKAKLVLTDEENMLDSGVDIIAQPPGKKLQSISLLSGGEKALTAVALIFSLFLHRPSPFCLLDEVDAPLDDANIDRFNELIREMTKLSQFILITHNKRTMEMADTLYGVTMEEQGVSKLLSLALTNKKNEAA